MKRYKKRICDALLADELAGAGAVVLEGAKWCGKTTTAEQAAKSAIYIDEPGKFAEYDLMAHSRPGRILDGESPRLIDEWQLTPSLWDTIRYRIDHGSGPGRYILTGSSVPPKTDEIKHSGAGRFSWIRMRTMSLWESEESSGEVSLGQLFAHLPVTIRNVSWAGRPRPADQGCPLLFQQGEGALPTVRYDAASCLQGEGALPTVHSDAAC